MMSKDQSLFMGGDAKKNTFLGKKFEYFLANFEYQSKNKYPLLAKNVTEKYRSNCHTCPLPLLWHEFNKCLCNFVQSKVSCCLHMYFL